MHWRDFLSNLALLVTLTGCVCAALSSDNYYGEEFNSLYSPTDRLIVAAGDNRKPTFRNCKGYAPSVKEESPPGTFVMKVEADDPDEKDTIEYSFVTAASERPKFRIDSKTGVITLMYTFDRDEPIREKEVYVTVRATDNGRPPLDDVCTFRILIEDVNDNPPVFDKAKYEESMSEDIQVNSVVMRISASDFDDGPNSEVKYEILPDKDSQYFRIDENNGLIYLARPIDRNPGQFYILTVRAYNIIIDQPQDAQIEVKIRVIESNKKPPTFINPPTEPIYLKENFSDYSKSLVILKAQSNVPDKPEVIFELITGRTEQTNSKKTFVFTQGEEDVSITLGKALDYEAITDYTLTMSVKNTHDLVAETLIKVKVLDVNDNIPYFTTELATGTISENEPPGTPVMQVRAFDMDGTAENNIVSFELSDNTDIFAIDPNTGNITALTTFDREERDFYNVKVIATDNSPSSLYNTGQHNVGSQVFRISIADKNDHPPHFTRDEFISDKVPEDANINFLVIEVTAEDADAASQITYTIVSGNTGDAFKIDPSTGKITVNNSLDYETTTDYELRVRAYDGVYEDNALVRIKIENVNDVPPKFLEDSYKTTIPEEIIVEGCILHIEAYDPDIKDRNAPQYIKYFIVKSEQQNLLAIDNDGCLRLIQPLDRDEPNGHKNWQIIVAAMDEDGSGLRAVVDVLVTLTDVNDNAPILEVKMPVIWPERKQPGNIITLKAKDLDEPHNGPPFHYEIDPNPSEDIKSKFGITGDILIAMDIFDREEQKEYFIPILISDSGQPIMRNVSILHVVIGDINDNEMKEGSSSIFVYNYKGECPDTEIGRVYVNDPDDWDLPDKFFTWKDGIRDDSFSLNADTGMITMLEGTREGDYRLFFTVTEESRDIPRHSVTAEVTVTVREIPEIAVDKSGSIRFYGITAEEFIVAPTDGSAGGKSHKDRFQASLARTFNVSLENVDVFTVLQHEYNSSYLDVRYSAHGSPYYEPEKLNGLVGSVQEKLEEELGVHVLMVNIDECLMEKYKCETSCTNVLHKSNVPLLVYTNQSSFVGVNAFVHAECICSVPMPSPQSCLNGGTPFDDSCECAEGYEGPFCEVISIGFHGGYAWYPPLNPCETTNISLELSIHRDHGLVLYVGPMNYNPLLPQDFLSLEIVDGYPILLVDYGSGSIKIEHKHIQLKPGKSYTIDINMQQTSIEMTVDNCRLSTCMSLGAPQGPNEFLNVNAPLQLGGSAVNLEYLASQYRWQHVPQSLGYYGCVRNLTVNGRTYNIGAPSVSKNVDIGCQRSMAVAVAFGIDKNFLIAILVCIAVLLFLILAVVVHKRHQDGWHEKDIDDIRENIIRYEDEGGGERDTDYDLNVFRIPQIYEDKPYKESLQREALNEMPDDIGIYLVDKKGDIDKQNDAHPVDDVRYYAYEGDGNSTGSLSSLASCTDDGDLKFDYLSNFGPRFRKLADMYGEESDIDSNGDAEEGWRI